jgi:CRP-like cAMP-binding protein
MGRGEGFGEIALLGDSIRTMTVRAVGPVRLHAISSAVFVPAVTSISEAHSAAQATRSAFLEQEPGMRVEDPDQT